MSRRYQWYRCVPGKTGTKIPIIVPIAQTERKDVSVGPGSQIVDITSHIGIIFFNQSIISIGFVIHKRENDQCSPPFGRLGKGFKPRSFKKYVFGGSSRHSSVGMLGIRHILHNLRSESCQVIIV